MIRTATNGKVFRAKWSSCTRWRQFSCPASLPVDETKIQRLRKKVPIVERRAMVKSFVTRYREAHAGKFPSSTETLKQVGGSYYVIRKILQQLEHEESKSSSLEGNKEISSLKVKELTDDAAAAAAAQCFTNLQNVSTKGETDKRALCDQQTVSLFDSKLGYGAKHSTKEEPQQTSEKSPLSILESHHSLIAHEKGLPGYVRKDTSILHGQIEEVEGSHLDLSAAGSCPKESKLGVKQSEDRQYKTSAKDPAKEPFASGEVTEIDIRFHREEPSKTDKSAWQTRDGVAQTKSSMWGSLKSITDSILSMWKRL